MYDILILSIFCPHYRCNWQINSRYKINAYYIFIIILNFITNTKRMSKSIKIDVEKHKTISVSFQLISVATIKEIREEDYQQWRGTAETVPILVTKADRQPVMAVLPWKKLQALIGLERSTDGEQRKAGPADG